MSIASNDPDENPYTFFLQGRVGSLPPIRVVAGDGATVPAGGSYALPDTGMSVPVSRAFLIFNDGTTDLTLASPIGLVSGTGFSQIGDPPAATIPAGGSTVFRVRLLHSQAGSYNGAVTIETLDGAQRPYRFAVTGRVASPDFALAASPAARNLDPGENVGYTIGVTGLFGFTTPVALTLSGQPAGVTFAFTPASVTPGGSSALRVFTTGSTPVGSYRLTVTGTAGGLVRTASVDLNVHSVSDFGLVASPPR